MYFLYNNIIYVTNVIYNYNYKAKLFTRINKVTKVKKNRFVNQNWVK
jgi:hypothetical protein